MIGRLEMECRLQAAVESASQTLSLSRRNHLPELFCIAARASLRISLEKWAGLALDGIAPADFRGLQFMSGEDLESGVGHTGDTVLESLQDLADAMQRDGRVTHRLGIRLVPLKQGTRRDRQPGITTISHTIGIVAGSSRKRNCLLRS
jgi:hypothetical protein